MFSIGSSRCPTHSPLLKVMCIKVSGSAFLTIFLSVVILWVVSDSVSSGIYCMFSIGSSRCPTHSPLLKVMCLKVSGSAFLTIFLSVVILWVVSDSVSSGIYCMFSIGSSRCPTHSPLLKVMCIKVSGSAFLTIFLSVVILWAVSDSVSSGIYCMFSIGSSRCPTHSPLLKVMCLLV